MKVTPKQKKILGFSVAALCLLFQLILFGTLVLLAFFDDLPPRQSDIISLSFLICLMLFPLQWGYRLWHTGRRESEAARTPSPFRTLGKRVVTVETRIELPQYRKLTYQLAYSRPTLIFIHFLGLSIAAYYIAMGFADNWWVFFIAFFLLYLPFGIYRSSTIQYKSNKSLNEHVTYNFTADAVTAIGETYTSTTRWSTLYKIVERKHWVLLYTNQHVAIMIPKTAFASPEDSNTIAQMRYYLTK